MSTLPLFSWLSASPGVMISLTLLVGGALITTVLGVMMVRQGLSLRPMLWFAALFSLIVLPQLVWHLHVALQGVAATPASENGTAADDWWTSPSPAPDTPDAIVRYFGNDAVDAMVSDVTRLFDPLTSKPRWAQFAVFADGRTTIIAAFNEAQETEAAVIDYLALSGLADTAVGNTDSGFTATRVTGEAIFVHRAGRHMGIWTGPDQQALNQNVVTSPFYHATRGWSAEEANPGADKPPLGLSWPGAASLLALYTAFVAVVFVKGAAWASALPARKADLVDSLLLRSRLLRLNSSDIPLTISPGQNPDELVVEWRYADGRWTDHARLHAIRRVHRLVLRQDCDLRSVFVSTYVSHYDASIGPVGASFDWTFATGVIFFQRERHHVFGITLDENLRSAGDLSHAWSFDMQRMTNPLIDIVTGSGWGWRPVVWKGPRVLRWFWS